MNSHESINHRHQSRCLACWARASGRACRTYSMLCLTNASPLHFTSLFSQAVVKRISLCVWGLLTRHCCVLGAGRSLPALCAAASRSRVGPAPATAIGQRTPAPSRKQRHEPIKRICHRDSYSGGAVQCNTRPLATGTWDWHCSRCIEVYTRSASDTRDGDHAQSHSLLFKTILC